MSEWKHTHHGTSLRPGDLGQGQPIPVPYDSWTMTIGGILNLGIYERPGTGFELTLSTTHHWMFKTLDGAQEAGWVMAYECLTRALLECERRGK